MVDQNDMTTFKNSSFKFSSVNLNTAELSTEQTLVVICVDKSVSISSFRKDLEAALKEVVRSCKDSPRSDNLLIRVVTFDRTVEEFHGFQEFSKCDLTSYDDMLESMGGSTSLYDGICDGLNSLSVMSKEMDERDYDTNGLLICLSDGLENSSSAGINTVKQMMESAVKEKELQSLISILIGVNVNDPAVSRELDNLHKTVGFTQYVDAGQANAKNLAKLAQFVSKSISSQSQALTTSVAAQSLTF